VPVIGLVQVGGQAMADRYTYLPSIGLLLALVWGVAEFAGGVVWRVRVASGLAVAVLVAFAALTVRQIGYWRDGETIFRHALATTERNYFAHRSLALALASGGPGAGAGGEEGAAAGAVAASSGVSRAASAPMRSSTGATVLERNSVFTESAAAAAEGSSNGSPDAKARETICSVFAS
jgi:hypothetical protein